MFVDINCLKLFQIVSDFVIPEKELLILEQRWPHCPVDGWMGVNADQKA